MRRRLLAAAAVGSALAGLASAASAASSLPQLAATGPLPQREGTAVRARPIRAFAPPRHPFMAPNGRSNLHEDAYQTDASPNPGPLGPELDLARLTVGGECASITFDRRGRLVTVCVGLDRPRLKLIEPRTLRELGNFDLPPRPARPGADIFTNFAGGGYFYLDQQDRAVVPTFDRRILVVRETGATGERAFAVAAAYSLRRVVRDGDQLISALPDWQGRLWFASKGGVVGYVERRSGRVHARALGEPIGNSFAVDEHAVYVVTDVALYRFEAGRGGAPRIVWRVRYRNDGRRKPGQTQAGSGTTPTLLGRDLVAITNNADPIEVVALKRAPRVRGPRVVCRVPVFARGASSTDQSLIGIGRSLIVENNYGYSPLAVNGGRSTAPGIWRIDLSRHGRGCRVVWRAQISAPSVVPKVSRRTGLVYTYEKPPRGDGRDPWYLTAIDFRSGRVVWRRLVGEGQASNNNYAPITLAPDGTLYLGVIPGLLAFRQ
ncbi:hypothetical protein [Thermoleophilum album]|uniref:PQQ-like domain-containing protein n=1 Tax=Thermoleophilum album TaxID=29539 RepID=A0A1H6FP75_THEAL|nr:hypothetical protein [Thermoleophilum album]SEH12719.1 hypothetical protein SAMN02745716_1183 [Thermoleophilum album]